MCRAFLAHPKSQVPQRRRFETMIPPGSLSTLVIFVLFFLHPPQILSTDSLNTRSFKRYVRRQRRYVQLSIYLSHLASISVK